MIHADLSGVRIRLRDADEGRIGRLRRDWAPFLTDGPAKARVDLDVTVEPVDQQSASGPFLPKEMKARFDGAEARFEMPEGSALASRPGTLSVRLLRSVEDRPYFTMMNYIRAGLAWCMAARRMALIHAAGLELEGRAFALVGPEGSGKTTWAKLGAAGGARVLSDDLLLIDASSGTPHVLGAPFRSTYREPMRPGRWPLACWLSPEHAAAASLRPLPSMLLRARLAANLTFVAEALERDEATAATLEAIGSAPSRTLRFARDESFLDVLREFRST